MGERHLTAQRLRRDRERRLGIIGKPPKPKKTEDRRRCGPPIASMATDREYTVGADEYLQLLRKIFPNGCFPSLRIASGDREEASAA